MLTDTSFPLARRTEGQSVYPHLPTVPYPWPGTGAPGSCGGLGPGRRGFQQYVRPGRGTEISV